MPQIEINEVDLDLLEWFQKNKVSSQPTDKKLLLLREKAQLEDELGPSSTDTAGKALTQAALGTGEALGSIVSGAGAMIEADADEARMFEPIERRLLGPRKKRTILGKLPEESAPSPAEGALPSITKLRKKLGRAISKEGKRQTREFTEAREAVGGGPVSALAGDFANTLTQTAPSIFASILGGPALAGAAAGTQTMGGMLDQGAENLQARFPDMSRDEALEKATLPAAIAGTITAGLTRWFGIKGDKGLETMTRRLAQAISNRAITPKMMREGVGSVVRSAGIEVPEEMLDEFSQGLIEKVSTNPDKEWSDIMSQTLHAGAMAAMISGAVGGPMFGAGKLVSKKPQELSPGQPVELRHPETGDKMIGAVVNVSEDGETGEAVLKVMDKDGKEWDVPGLNVREARPIEEPAEEEVLSHQYESLERRRGVLLNSLRSKALSPEAKSGLEVQLSDVMAELDSLERQFDILGKPVPGSGDGFVEANPKPSELDVEGYVRTAHGKLARGEAFDKMGRAERKILRAYERGDIDVTGIPQGKPGQKPVTEAPGYQAIRFLIQQSIEENIARKRGGITQKAADLLDGMQEVPPLVTKDLEEAALENGIQVDEDTTAQHVINRLQAKRSKPTREFSVGERISFYNPNTKKQTFGRVEGITESSGLPTLIVQDQNGNTLTIHSSDAETATQVTHTGKPIVGQRVVVKPGKSVGTVVSVNTVMGNATVEVADEAGNTERVTRLYRYLDPNIPEVTEEVKETPKPAKKEKPVKSNATSSSNVLLIAQSFHRRLKMLKNRKKLDSGQTVLFNAIDKALKKRKISDSDVGRIAKVLGLSVDETQTELPEAFSHLGTPPRRTQDATTQRKVGQDREAEHRGDGQEVQEEAANRENQTKELEARTEDSSGSSAQPGTQLLKKKVERPAQSKEFVDSQGKSQTAKIPPKRKSWFPLTNNQANNYTGGVVIFPDNQEGVAPLEVLKVQERSFLVRDLSTGKVWSILFSRVTFGDKELKAILKARDEADQSDVEDRKLLKALNQQLKKQKGKDAPKSTIRKTERAIAKVLSKIEEREEVVEQQRKEALLEEHQARLRQGFPIAGPGKKAEVLQQTTAPTDFTEEDVSQIMDGSSVTDEASDITYDQPIDVRNRFIVRALAAAVGQLKSRFKSIQISKIRYVVTKGNDPAIFTRPGTDGFDTLNVDLGKLATQVSDITADGLARYLNAAVGEELFHNAGGLVAYREWINRGGPDGEFADFEEFHDQYYKEIYADMSESQVAKTRRSYGLEEHQHVQIAAEFTRALIQKKMQGVTTEESLGSRIVNWLKNMAAQLNELINQARTGPTQNKLIEHLLAVEDILLQQEKVEGVEVKAGRREGRKFGAKAVTEREVASMFINTVSPAQVREARRNTYIQNESAAGFARTQYEPLSDGAKSHLRFLQMRYDNADEMASRLGQNEVSGQTLQEQVESLPEDQRLRAIGTAWDNTHDMILRGLSLQRRLVKAIDTLEASLKDPVKSKNKVVRKSRQKLRDGMLHDWRLKMSQLRHAALSREDDATVKSVDKLVRRVSQFIKDKATVFERTVSLFYETRDPASITKKALGIGESEFKLVKDIVETFGRVKAEELVGNALSKEQTLVNQLKEANDFMEASVFGNQTHEANLQYMTDSLGLEQQVVTQSDVDMKFQRPFNLEQQVVVRFNTERGLDQEDEEKLYALAAEMEEFIATPGVNPIRKAAYERHKENIYSIYTNSHFKSGSVKLMTNELTMWQALLNSFGARPNTPEYRLVGIGGKAMNLAMMRLRNFSQALNMVGRIHREHSTGIEFAADRAANEHGVDHDVWIEEVANPILAGMQDIGGKRRKAGDKILGRVITEKDMEAVRRQHKFVESVIGELGRLQTVQNKAFPQKIRDKSSRAFAVDRDAMPTGPMTMPRRVNSRAKLYSDKWVEIKAMTGTDAESASEIRIKEMEKMVGGEMSQPFLDLIVGHMRSTAEQPSYNRFIQSKFDQEYREMIEAMDEGNDLAPSNFSDVVDYLATNYNARSEPEDQMTADQIKQQVLFKEVGRFLGNVRQQAKNERPESMPTGVTDVIRSDNFLNKPRGMAILPDSLFTYTTASVTEQFQVLHSVHELYGQQYYDSLRTVHTQLDEAIKGFEAKRTALKRSGVKQARKKVRRESEDLQREGETLFNWDEALYHKRHIERAMEFIRNLQTSKRDFFNEDLRTGFRAMRRIIATGILNNPGIVFRNRLGGTIRNAQLVASLGLSRRVFGMYIPGTRIVLGPATELLKDAASMVSWAFQSRFLASRFLKSKLWTNSKLNERLMEKHKDFFDQWAAGLIGIMQNHASTYDRAREFGLAGDAAWLARMRNYFLLWDSGGRLRADDPTTAKKALRTLETVANVAYELGLHNMSPRSVLSHTADMEANFYGMKKADWVVLKLKENALKFLKLREENGMSLERGELLTPQELVGHSLADEKNATMTRNLFGKAGINVDQKMAEYYKKWKEATANGLPADSVSMLSTEEANSLMMVMADEVNRASYANRPEALTQSEIGKWVLMFMGYPIWQNTKFAEARARLSNTFRNPVQALGRGGGLKGVTKSGTVRGWWEILKYLTATVMIGAAGEEPIRAIIMAAYAERRQTKSIFQSKDWVDAARTMIENAGNQMPIMMGVVNTVTEQGIKPGVGIGRSGVSSVPWTLANSIFKLMRDTISTGDGSRPAIRFMAQWFPNTKGANLYIPSLGFNRIPFNSGVVEYGNVKKAIRSAIPRGMEYRKPFFGNVYALGASTDRKDNVLNALGMASGTHWPTVMRERRMGIKENREAGVKDPDKAFDNAVIAKNPFQSVFGRKVTQAERSDILSRMSDKDKKALRRVEAAFQAYARAVGRSLSLTTEVSKLKSISLPPRPRQSSRPRGLNPLLSPSESSRLLR